MRRISFLLLLLIYNPLITFSQSSSFHYPETKKNPVVDDYFGTKIADNYRWLENMDDSQVKDWFKAQGDYTESILSKIPGRDELLNELLKLDSVRELSIGSIERAGNNYFYLKGYKGENIPKLYYRTGKTGNEVLLFDPTTYETGKSYTIQYIKPSNDGNKLAFGISLSGSEQARILIMDVEKKILYPESIYPSWFGISDWTDDNSSFIYTEQKSGNVSSKDLLLDTRVKIHVIGTDPSNDKMIFSRSKYPELGIVPEDLLFVGMSDDRKYIIGSLGGVQREEIDFFAPVNELTSEHINWKPLFKKENCVTGSFFANDSIYFITYKDAPNFKIMVTPASFPDVSTARTVIPEAGEHIRYFAPSKNYFFAVLSNGIDQYAIKYNFSNGNVSRVPAPAEGVVNVSPYDVYGDDCILTVSGWTQTPTRYEYDAVSDKFVLSEFNTAVTYPGSEDLVVKEVEAKSYDGVMVPLSIIMDKNTPVDGSAPCYLTGYGAYGSSSTPGFSIAYFTLIRHGVIVAVAHVRGGGEKGDAWRLGGFKQTKPNTWKDFIACAEYLINNKYTSNTKLCGEGTSAGGILIGRAITERPDLFGAAICNVGVANILRAEVTPNGPNNTREFGTIKDESECKAMIEMDALYHVKDGTKYPAVFCNTGINDPRVASWQPGKFAGALQNSSSSAKPVLLRVDYNSGHFSMEKRVTFKLLADMYSFFLWQAGSPDFQMK